MKDVVIFGAGQAGHAVLRDLEKKCHILFVADNDEQKWGSSIEGYGVKSPDEILRRDCDIAIALTDQNYINEIIAQLGRMGIGEERIYSCKGYFSGGLFKWELHPLDARNTEATGRKLIEYDLLGKEEDENGCTRVLIFCTFYSVYTKQLIENMSKRYSDIEFSLLTKAEENERNIHSEQLKHIYCFRTNEDLKTILDQLPVYDAMQLLWIEHEWAYFYRMIREKAKRLNLNVGGSDFYRAGKEEREFKRKLIACADAITAETAGTVREFGEYYQKEAGNKMGLLPFGVNVLDFIDLSRNHDREQIRKKHNIPPGRLVVVCGHNAIEEHRHMEMIEAVDGLPDSIKKRIVCVFPMTYPKSEHVSRYISRVRERLGECGISSIILTEFMDFQSMAEYALASDIMIHVQTTDQLSSTMLERMHAGCVVIAGSWLPYGSLHEKGIYFLDVDAVPDVTAVLCDVVENIEEYKDRCRVNMELVWEHSSWDRLAPRWRALWG